MSSIDYKDLISKGKALSQQFDNNLPFEHIVIDNFLPEEFFRQVVDVFPAPQSDVWKTPSNKHTQGKMVTRRGELDIKELLYESEARTILREFNSGGFINFLEKLSGINGLIGDPHFAEAGFHCTGNGGYLNAHADFSHHDKLGLERRLNVIYFLNDEWQESFGGHLNLYDTEMNCVQSVLPIANRCVIFKTSEVSYHGHPKPMILPENTFRKSLAFYYYTLPTGRQKARIKFPEDINFVPVRSEE